jgi:hypothetical protein
MREAQLIYKRTYKLLCNFYTRHFLHETVRKKQLYLSLFENLLVRNLENISLSKSVKLKMARQINVTKMMPSSIINFYF